MENIRLTNGTETFLLGSVNEDEHGAVHASDSRGSGYTRCDAACDHEHALQKYGTTTSTQRNCGSREKKRKETNTMITNEYIEMSNSALKALYDQRRRDADGDSVGSDPAGMPSKQSVADAVAAEGWDVVRDMSDRPDVDTLLVRDGDALYIVSDVGGPWAIQLTYADGSDRLGA